MDLSKLSGTEYQKLIFERLIHKLFPDHRVLAVEDYAQGAVDYIVREHPGTGMLSADRFHYFECKNYSRQLELDNVAKIMVVAVADQPSTVHVVSRTGLQPQIKKYAARIFNVDGNSSPIFRGITFRHWITEEIGDFRKTDMGYGEEDQPHGDGGLWWWISECSAFAETEISSWSSPRREITLRHGSLLILTLESRELQAATIEVQGIPQTCWTPIIAEDGTAASARHSYLIDTAEFEFDRVYTVTVKMARGVADTRIPIGYFQVHAADVYLPELRSAEIDRLVSEIGSSGQFRLILVDGEAGVGKTHLIERVAEELRAKAGFDVMRLTVSEENCEGLMGALLHGCLAPPIGRGEFQELADALQKILIHQAGGETRETDISLLARVATGMGPRVIVLRDCHHLTAAVASEIWTLIMALDDASWGGVRLVLEYRQPDAQLNAALQTLIHKARLKIRKVLLERPVSPLDETQFASMARRLFTDVTDDLIRSLRQRTGGLPLFIDSYLRRLSHLGLIVRQKGQEPFSIAQPAQVLADALLTDGQVILEERVRTWLRNAFGEGDEERAVVIGLLAMADDGRGQALMRTALGLSGDEVKAVQKRLEDGEIGYGRPDGQILFRHDLLRIAAIAVASGYDSFSLRAGQVARELLGDGEATGNAVLIHSLRIRIFSQLADSVALETELRTGARAAKEAGDYGRLISFLTQLLALLKDRSNVGERLDLMKELAWATWVSDSLLAARERYMQLAKAAESCMEGDFSIADAAATDAYRRAIGIDLELIAVAVPPEHHQRSLSAPDSHHLQLHSEPAGPVLRAFRISPGRPRLRPIGLRLHRHRLSRKRGVGAVFRVRGDVCAVRSGHCLAAARARLGYGHGRLRALQQHLGDHGHALPAPGGRNRPRRVRAPLDHLYGEPLLRDIGARESATGLAALAKGRPRSGRLLDQPHVSLGAALPSKGISLGRAQRPSGACSAAGEPDRCRGAVC